MDRELFRLELWGVLAGAIGVMAVTALVSYAQSHDSDSVLATGSYVALEHDITTKINASDNDSVNAGYLYLINQSKGLGDFDDSYFPPLNASLKAIFMNNWIYGPSGCHGGYLETTGIYSLPAAPDNVTIAQIDGTGRISLTYQGRNLDLGPGETWNDVTTRLVAVPYDGSLITINVTVIDSLRNQGIILKSGAADGGDPPANRTAILPVFY